MGIAHYRPKLWKTVLAAKSALLAVAVTTSDPGLVMGLRSVNGRRRSLSWWWLAVAVAGGMYGIISSPTTHDGSKQPRGTCLGDER